MPKSVTIVTLFLGFLKGSLFVDYSHTFAFSNNSKKVWLLSHFPTIYKTTKCDYSHKFFWVFKKMDRFFTQVRIQNPKSLERDKKCRIFVVKLTLLNPFQNNSKNALFRKSLIACPKIVGAGHPAPRSKLLECALNLRCWPTRSRADRPSYSSAKVLTYWRNTL